MSKIDPRKSVPCGEGDCHACRTLRCPCECHRAGEGAAKGSPRGRLAELEDEVHRLRAALQDAYDAAQNARRDRSPNGRAFTGTGYTGPLVLFRDRSPSWADGFDRGASTAAMRVSYVLKAAGVEQRHPSQENRDAGRPPVESR